MNSLVVIRVVIVRFIVRIHHSDACISVAGLELFVQPRFGPSLGTDGGDLDQDVELSVL